LAEPPLPAMHPYGSRAQKKAATWRAGLEHDYQRDAARQTLRGFLEKVVIPPRVGMLRVAGNLEMTLAAARGRILRTGRFPRLIYLSRGRAIALCRLLWAE
jgi:hypothetical protein